MTDNTCKSCNIGCRRCYSTYNCSSCLTGYLYVSDFGSCSKICSQSQIYFMNGVCADSCLSGTFLLPDLVTCQKCSTTCSSCSGSGSNCTKCANKFWYNYNCVDKCPDSFYVDANNSCRDCQSNMAACAI